MGVRVFELVGHRDRDGIAIYAGNGVLIPGNPTVRGDCKVTRTVVIQKSAIGLNGERGDRTRTSRPVPPDDRSGRAGVQVVIEAIRSPGHLPGGECVARAL